MEQVSDRNRRMMEKGRMAGAWCVWRRQIRRKRQVQRIKRQGRETIPESRDSGGWRQREDRAAKDVGPAEKAREVGGNKE